MLISQIICVFIGSTNGIRVVEDENENGTAETPTSTASKLEMPQVATTSNFLDNNQTNATLMHKSGYVYNPMKLRYVLIRFLSSSHLNIHEYECQFNLMCDTYFNCVL